MTHRQYFSLHRAGWSRRDLAAALGLFAATAAFALWQSTQVAILWDVGYLLDSSWRMALGQVPYRDFPFVHPPLTFLIQAAIMRLGGRLYLWTALYAALVGGLGTVITWHILIRVTRDRLPQWWAVSLLLALPLIFLGTQGIYPHPIYDCDCAFAVLVALLLLYRFESGPSARGPLRVWMSLLFTGVAVVAPLFFKQNIGLIFLAVVVGSLLLLLALQRRASDSLVANPDRGEITRLLASIGVILGTAIAGIGAYGGVKNYLHWTIQFAGQRRLPRLHALLAVYHQPPFMWMLPCLGLGFVLLRSRFSLRLWCRVLAFCLLASPFLGTVVLLFFEDSMDDRAEDLLALFTLFLLIAGLYALADLRKGITFARLLPFLVLAAIHGTFLSQELWGSTYAIWPLLMILVAGVLASLREDFVARMAESGMESDRPGKLKSILSLGEGFPLGLAGAISVTFLACGGVYAISHERLDYIDLSEGPVYHATLPALRGMSARGPYLPNFEELVRFTEQEIPMTDGLLLLPGEDPFYYATGRTPQFPVLLFTKTTDPYSPEQLKQAAQEYNIRWIIVKRRLQLAEDPMEKPEETVAMVTQNFALFRKLAGYDVYLRR